MDQKPHFEYMLGIPISSDSEENILKYMLSALERGGEKHKIFTPNPEILMYAQSHSSFKTILQEASVNLPDGVGLLLASRLLGLGIKERITGVDFMESLCQAISEHNLAAKRTKKKLISTGFFGGRGDVAKRAAECLQKKYSGLQISYASSEYDEAEMQRKKPDVLFVAMGFPKQETWISQNLEKLPVTIAMGVGGAFDFLAGEVPRAPGFLRSLGLEWLFRLTIQPWRWKRQLQLISFMLLVLREAIQVRLLGKKM